LLLSVCLLLLVVVFCFYAKLPKWRAQSRTSALRSFVLVVFLEAKRHQQPQVRRRLHTLPPVAVAADVPPPPLLPTAGAASGHCCT
jgi:hypothetical protein